MAFDQSSNSTNRWLAFELSVLRRLKFNSVLIPFVGEPDLGVHLKRWGVRVLVNDCRQWAWTKSVARVENNHERLAEDDLEILLADAYVPGYELRHKISRKWFREIDAWWFDNVRAQAENLDSKYKRALAISLLISAADYARSFNDETLLLRQPLSAAFRRLWKIEQPPINNKQENICHAGTARDFLAEARGDLLFLRLPQAELGRNAQCAWREEYARGADDFWRDLRTQPRIVWKPEHTLKLNTYDSSKMRLRRVYTCRSGRSVSPKVDSHPPKRSSRSSAAYEKLTPFIPKTSRNSQAHAQRSSRQTKE